MPLINIQSKELERFSPQWWQVRCSVLFIILRGKSLPWLFICKGETQGSSVDGFSVVLPAAARARPAAQGPVQCDTWQGPQRCNCPTLTLHALQQVAASEGDQPESHQIIHLRDVGVLNNGLLLPLRLLIDIYFERNLPSSSSVSRSRLNLSWVFIHFINCDFFSF